MCTLFGGMPASLQLELCPAYCCCCLLLHPQADVAADPSLLQDGGRQSRQVKLLCACVSLVLQRQPAALAESLPELLAFCIQARGYFCSSRSTRAESSCCCRQSGICRHSDCLGGHAAATENSCIVPQPCAACSNRGTSRPRSSTASCVTWSWPKVRRLAAVAGHDSMP